LDLAETRCIEQYLDERRRRPTAARQTRIERVPTGGPSRT